MDHSGMQDLNDFAPAGGALGRLQSKLSRRIASPEDRLGVRLLRRSTRRFEVTDVGRAPS
jgi:DNA-binding transcriptional LysR family regulator